MPELTKIRQHRPQILLIDAAVAVLVHHIERLLELLDLLRGEHGVRGSRGLALRGRTVQR